MEEVWQTSLYTQIAQVYGSSCCSILQTQIAGARQAWSLLGRRCRKRDRKSLLCTFCMSGDNLEEVVVAVWTSVVSSDDDDTTYDGGAWSASSDDESSDDGVCSRGTPRRHSHPKTKLSPPPRLRRICRKSRGC